MKTKITADLIIESDRFDDLIEPKRSRNHSQEISYKEIVKILRSGKYELVEVVDNYLQNEQRPTLVIKEIK